MPKKGFSDTIRSFYVFPYFIVKEISKYYKLNIEIKPTIQDEIQPLKFHSRKFYYAEDYYLNKKNKYSILVLVWLL